MRLTGFRNQGCSFSRPQVWSSILGSMCVGSRRLSCCQFVLLETSLHVQQREGRAELHTHTYVYMYMYVYTHAYSERERERDISNYQHYDEVHFVCIIL